MTQRRRIVSALGVTVWSVLWFAPWHSMLQPWPWLRASLALALWLTPGVGLHALVMGRAPSRLSARLAYGLALAMMLTGLVGLSACLVHVSFAAALATLWAAGAVVLLVLTISKRVGGRPRQPIDFVDVLYLLPAVLTGLVGARLAFVPAGGSDKFSQVARIAGFLHADALGFQSIGFGSAVTIPPRYWLAYWPLGEATISALSGLHPLELATNYLAPLLAALAFIAMFELAMSLGCSRRLAALTLIAHLAGLLALAKTRQAGFIFFLRLTEDKTLGAFVLAPICFAAVARYFAESSMQRLLLVGLVYVGLAFVHPTSFGIACLITFAYGAAEVVATSEIHRVAKPMVLIAAIAAVFSVPRFVEHPAQSHIHFSVSSARAAGELQEHRRKKLDIVGDDQRVTVPASVVPVGIRVVGLAALLVALVRLRRDRAARFVVGALVVTGLTFLSATAWIIGLAITPFHLWRVVWQAPFGIGGAVSLRPLLDRGVQWRQRPLLLAAGEVALLAVLLVAMLPSRRALRVFPIPPDWRTVLHTEEELYQQRPSCRRTYADLTAIGRMIDAQAPNGAIVVGDVPDTNNFLPSISTKARLLVFRQPIETALHASVTLAEAHTRQVALRRVFAADTPAVERLRILADYQVDLVLHCGHWPAATELTTSFPGRFRLAASAGDFQLYRVGGIGRGGTSG